MSNRSVHIPTEPNVHRNLGGAFAEGSAYLNATPITVDVVLSAAGMGKLYFKATKGGTLKLEILRSGADGVYTAKAHADVTVSDATESVTTITLMGERGLRVTFTPGADGVITYADIAAILGIQ